MNKYDNLMDFPLKKSCLKIKVFEVKFQKKQKKGSYAIRIQSKNGDFKQQNTKFTQSKLKWDESFQIELKNFEDEIEVSLQRKNFFQKETSVGGFSFNLSQLKGSSKKDWCFIYPIIKKKTDNQKYLLSVPIAELLISIELDLTKDELKEYIFNYHATIINMINGKIRHLEEEDDDDDETLSEMRKEYEMNRNSLGDSSNYNLSELKSELMEDISTKYGKLAIRSSLSGENNSSNYSNNSKEDKDNKRLGEFNKSFSKGLLNIQEYIDKNVRLISRDGDILKNKSNSNSNSNNLLTISRNDVNVEINGYQHCFDNSSINSKENDTDGDISTDFDGPDTPTINTKRDEMERPYRSVSSIELRAKSPKEIRESKIKILKGSNEENSSQKDQQPKKPWKEILMGIKERKFMFEYLSFNDRFQSAVEKMRSTKMAEMGEASDLLINVAEDFLWSAKTYGKIIISEYKLPDHLKTIKPHSGQKGILGGTKYYYKGIFYKLAEADGEIISNIEAAAKIAGHELKGCSSYYNTSVNGLSYPLIACIDYRGFRLIAMTILPVDEKTLVVGTNDGGKNIHSECKEINHKLEKAGKILNIKPHYVFDHFMYSACDLEGHKAGDGRYYLLDFSRVMPPEYPSHPEEIFYKLLRPEFVSGYHIPLSSDAFSGFKGKGSYEDNMDSKVATEDLHKLIRSFAREFCELVDKEIDENWENILPFHQKLPRIIHQAGINMRHLGILYNHSSSYNCKMLLLIEIAARTIKQKLREKMRNLMNESKYPTEHHYISVVVNYMNQIFTSFESWNEILESAHDYFKISKFDTIKHLKQRHEITKNIPKREERKKSSMGGFESKHLPDSPNRSSLGMSSELYFVSMEDIFNKSSTENSNDFLDSPDKEMLGYIITNNLNNSNNNVNSDPVKHRNSILGMTKSRRSMASYSSNEESEEFIDNEEDLLPLDLYHHITMFGGGFALLFFRIVRMMGFHFSSRVTDRFMNSVKTRINPRFLNTKNCFDRSDLESLGERIKHMNFIAQSQARAFYQKAKQSITQTDTDYFYQMAIDKLEEALDANPTSKVTLLTYAEILFDIQITTTHKNIFSLESPEIQKINQYYELARKYDPNDPVVLGNYAKFLSKCGEYDRAKLFFLKSIHLDITRSWTVERYACLLSDLGEKKEAENFYSVWNKFIELFKKKTNLSRSGSYMKPTKGKQVSK